MTEGEHLWKPKMSQCQSHHKSTINLLLSIFKAWTSLHCTSFQILPSRAVHFVFSHCENVLILNQNFTHLVLRSLHLNQSLEPFVKNQIPFHKGSDWATASHGPKGYPLHCSLCKRHPLLPALQERIGRMEGKKGCREMDHILFNENAEEEKRMRMFLLLQAKQLQLY